MTIFPKMWTREFPLIEYQIWGRSYKDYKRFFGTEIKLYPRYVFVLNDGLAEIYRNPYLTELANGIILNLAKENPRYLEEFCKSRLLLLSKMESIWNNPKNTREEFFQFCENFLYFWPAISASFFIPTSREFTAEQREYFIDLRRKIDVVEHTANLYIKSCLKNIYPGIGDLTWAVNLDDIQSDELDLDAIKKRATNSIFVVDDEVFNNEMFEKIKVQNNFELES